MSVISFARHIYHTHIKPPIDVESMSFLEGLKLKSNQSNVSGLSIEKLTAIYNGHADLLEATGDYTHVQNATTELAEALRIVSAMHECPGRKKLVSLLNTLENTRDGLASTWADMKAYRLKREGISCHIVEPAAEAKKRPHLRVDWDFSNLNTLQRWRIENDVPAPRPKRINHR